MKADRAMSPARGPREDPHDSRMETVSSGGCPTHAPARHEHLLVDVVPVEKPNLQRALVMPIDDFEDALRAAAGLKAGVEHVVTRNERDFARGPVPPIRPEELLALL